MDKHTAEHAHEPPGVVTWPLILLAIPSVIIGWMTASNVVFGDFFNGIIDVLPAHDVIGKLGEYHGGLAFIVHGFQGPAVYLAAAGVATAYVFYLVSPGIPAMLDSKLGFVRRVLENKYGFDDFNQAVFAKGSVGLGDKLWKVGDQAIIDGAMVNGSAKSIGLLAHVARYFQSGYLFHYAFAMIVGLLGMLTWFLFN